MYYQINENLEESTLKECLRHAKPYVAVVSSEEFCANRELFDMISERVARLQDIIASLREQTNLVRDLYNSQLDIKQNRIMTILTVVSTIFMPLTLITGWYGMNFKYMPELEKPWAYPCVLGVCLLIAVGCLIYFKKKKWL